jgi:general secretion pathway protein E
MPETGTSYNDVLICSTRYASLCSPRRLMTDPGTAARAQDDDPHTEAFAGRLGAFLLKRGTIDALAVRRAQRAQKQSGERFDVVTTRLGLVPEAEMTRALAEFLSLPFLEAAHLPRAPLLKEQLRLPFLKTHRLLPILDDPDRVVVAMADPFDLEAVGAMAYLLGRPVERCLAPPADLERAIEKLYGGNGEAADGEGIASLAEEASDDDIRRLEDMASEAPIIRLVHQLIVRAVEARASDIHVEPREDCLRVLFRIDGILHTVEALPPAVRAPVTSRIKIMAHLNIAERRLPQDGRIRTTVRGKDIDLRVSTMPTLHGESVVLRILDRCSVVLEFPALGFEGPTYEAFARILDHPNGIVLVTGPTGSGKTTTLYAALNALNNSERKIFTIEDPIEYQLAGINQVQVRPKLGLTFAAAFRSILRQDPDIIMVGEIRDLETAQIAIQASLTGHLVFSTVHTNSAAATVARLLDMGVEDYLLASSVTGVLAQRLVRRLCEACAAPADISKRFLDSVHQRGLMPATGLDAAGQSLRLRKKVGCEACRHTGFSGRTCIAEVLVMSDAVRDRILSSGTERSVEEAAVGGGMMTMFQDGLAKAFRGQTTVEEVLRATRIN